MPTDAYDTIDWLVKNVPECNGKVGTMGTSYDGFTVLMSLVNPHPALKAAVPFNPMVDTWIGDDWFSQRRLSTGLCGLYLWADGGQEVGRGMDSAALTMRMKTWLTAGSAGALGTSLGMDQLPFWKRLASQPGLRFFLAKPSRRQNPRGSTPRGPDSLRS